MLRGPTLSVTRRVVPTKRPAKDDVAPPQRVNRLEEANKERAGLSKSGATPDVRAKVAVFCDWALRTPSAL